MRLWSLHPRFLDSRALVAVWREGLLARAVLSGQTKGYRNHPQLVRFKNTGDPVAAIDAYLSEIVVEAESRGYRFDRSKIRFGRVETPVMTVTAGQIRHEWEHLNRKLAIRDPVRLVLQLTREPAASGFFRIVPGPVADWEKS